MNSASSLESVDGLSNSIVSASLKPCSTWLSAHYSHSDLEEYGLNGADGAPSWKVSISPNPKLEVEENEDEESAYLNWSEDPCKSTLQQ